MESKILRPWKTLSRRTILNHSEFLTVESHTVQLPDGRVITDWPWIIAPDTVTVLAVTTDQRFICFRQTKRASPPEVSKTIFSQEPINPD